MWKPTKWEAIIGGSSLAITIVLSIWCVQHRQFLEQIAGLGYVGCFAINYLPTPPGFSIVLNVTLGSVLYPAIVGAVAGTGEALGALTAYFTGYGGRGLFRNSTNSLYVRVDNLLHRHGSKAVFLMSFVINPMIYPFAAVLGMLRFGWLRFFLGSWAGSTAKTMILAYLGYFGLGSILRFLHVGS
ncbi:MAG TPA: VTT domain-containing protein [Dehalococcoidia bacterium]|nr:VTT domain-containing protein [Dehalococcoidia bacterium]